MSFHFGRLLLLCNQKPSGYEGDLGTLSGQSEHAHNINARLGVENALASEDPGKVPSRKYGDIWVCLGAAKLLDDCILFPRANQVVIHLLCEHSSSRYHRSHPERPSACDARATDLGYPATRFNIMDIQRIGNLLREGQISGPCRTATCRLLHCLSRFGP
jgi:hypothetical protein